MGIQGPQYPTGTLRMLHVLDQIVLWGFVLEIVVKMVAEESDPGDTFWTPGTSSTLPS